MKRIQLHLLRALLLGICLIACSALVLFTASFTSMTELRTGLVNDGKGLLCKHNRHASQLLHLPYFPASQWYVDLASGSARKLSNNDIVAKSLLRSHLYWQSMFDVETNIVRQNESAFDNVHDFGMRPVISGGKIEELVLNRTEYPDPLCAKHCNDAFAFGTGLLVACTRIVPLRWTPISRFGNRNATYGVCRRLVIQIWSSIVRKQTPLKPAGRSATNK